MLAEELKAYADQLNATAAFFTAARKQPLALISKPLDMDTLAVVKKLSPKLSSNVFMLVGVGAVRKIEVAAAEEDIGNSFASIMRFANTASSTEEDDLEMLNLQLIPPKEGKRVQHHVVVELAEKAFKLPIHACTAMVGKLIDLKLVPPHEKNVFTGHGGATAGWQSQPDIDLSLMSLMHLAMQVKASGITPDMATVFRNVVKEKACVTLRLRAFDGPRRAEGNGDIGRYAWEIIEQLAAENKDKDTVVGHVQSIWQTLQQNALLTDINSLDIEKFAACAQEQLMDAIVEMAQSVGSVGGCTSVCEMRTWCRRLLSQLAQILEENIMDAMSGDQLNKLVLLGKGKANGNKSPEPDDIDASDAFDLLAALFRFYDDLGLALDSNRMGKSTMEEFRARVELIQAMCQAHGDVADVDVKGQLHKWSQTYVQEKELPCSATSMPIGPNMAQALSSLQKNICRSTCDRVLCHAIERDQPHPVNNLVSNSYAVAWCPPH